ncbi:MAG: hypothetical protein IGR80_04985 [Synechococcales cyanobacterium K44_A2020_017]|uniref:hypothetical protein n=1 Tax=Leptolyngbya sp. CCY15150 TaxID=2767772 RepID=UPI00194EA5E4|nr:hypothetical protein [Leptolyngbya sp. CCY15150]MBF2090681.1 hypothetical protein [Synechococcales cyanobacterium K32_A2020_035]MBF2094095.1 hypothetical protein [Synechococcales cyanobacterium K44_A2020_017]
MANVLLERPSSPVTSSQPHPSEAIAASALTSSAHASIPETSHLPYCAMHQAELLSLQAEADALLHHLQALRQE